MALDKLNLSFWSQVAAGWVRTLAAGEREGIERVVVNDVAKAMADLIRNETRSQIKPALEAILEDDDEEDW